MTRGLALAALAALAAGPAAGLSCMEATPQSTFWTHENRTETFVAVRGGFHDLRKLRHDRAGDRVVWRATFRGHRASARAFDQPFSAKVEIVQPLLTPILGPSDPSALAGWLPGQTGIVYLERRGSGYRATVEFCLPFVDGDPASVRPTLACLAGRRCPRPR